MPSRNIAARSMDMLADPTQAGNFQMYVGIFHINVPAQPGFRSQALESATRETKLATSLFAYVHGRLWALWVGLVGLGKLHE